MPGAGGDDPEYLHQLRVGVRRLRSALQAFRRALPKKPRKRLVKALREVTPPLGAARDWDVFTAWLQSAATPDAVLKQARSRRTAARRRARRVLASRAWADALAQARRLRAEESSMPLKEFAAAAIARADARARKEARGIDWQDSAQRHALRIRLKRLRYTCDFLAHGFAPRRVSAYLGDLRRLQEILGDLNDVRVARVLLSAIESPAAAVHRRLAAREKAQLRKLVPAWRVFEKRPRFWQPRG